MDEHNRWQHSKLPASRTIGAGMSPHALLAHGADALSPLNTDVYDYTTGLHGSIDRDAKPGGESDGLGPVEEGVNGRNAVEEGITIDPWYQDLEDHDKSAGAIIDTPLTEERYFWTDPITAVKREIWRPGDGDGIRLDDYYDKPGPTAPLEKRWKFYQSRTGPGPIKFQQNEPPKYVVLDDRAAREVMSSDMPKSHITKYWPHDFGGNGTIRARRPHRGRGAIGDFEASGKDRFHFAMIANKRDGDRYYFSGEATFKPIIWNTNDYRLTIGIFKPEIKKLPTPPPKNQLKWNQHGHNQFTPKDQLVKFGAPRKGSSHLRYKDKDRTNDNSNIRDGRNRVPILEALNARTAESASREDSAGADSEGSREGAKRRRIGSKSKSASRERDGADQADSYITQLEKFIVESKEITDEQRNQIDSLEQKLFEAKRKIKLLEAEVAGLKEG